MASFYIFSIVYIVSVVIFLLDCIGDYKFNNRFTDEPATLGGLIQYTNEKYPAIWWLPFANTAFILINAIVFLAVFCITVISNIKI